MANPSAGTGAHALSMARAILGEGARIVGARFSGNAATSGIRDGAAALSTGAGRPDATASSFIDIDFVPDTDDIALGLTLAIADIPLDGAAAMLKRGVSLWLDGRPIPLGGPRPATSGGARYKFTAHPEIDGTLAITFAARIGVTPGRLASLRIATAALGTAAVFSTLFASPAEADPGNGQAVGNPNAGNNGNDNQPGNVANAPGQGGSGPPGGGNGGPPGGGGGPGGPGSGGNYIANDDVYVIFANSSATVDVTLNDIGPGNSEIFVIAINGQTVEPGDTITLSTGETVTLNEDGTLTITTDGDIGLSDFTYTAAYGKGNAQQIGTATVTIATVPCFVAGTMIRTADGDVPVETLSVGDRVLTRDDGPQPIRWIGTRTLDAEGRFAPIRIAKGALGDHKTLWVSPQHRILLQSREAELLFGTPEILVAAKDLIDGKRIRQVCGGEVTYVHLLFDRHQIIWSEGLMTESFLPGPQSSHCFSKTVMEEICAIFPELDPETGAGYGPSVRPALRGFEAKVLVA